MSRNTGAPSIVTLQQSVLQSVVYFLPCHLAQSVIILSINLLVDIILLDYKLLEVRKYVPELNKYFKRRTEMEY